ncbi:DUF717 domain-containing protein [Pseudomonas moraviensis]|uniref:DUF717 domain-containing protein n=1 Tax=Pseudomonas atacamensis TaxID=2565368 RepID=A0AAQ2DA12_9PSED|nr:DUF717 domain-containing protein [Pseudomonas moraviensis]THF29688.1 DUF717 domain-containing protein [Pseudomonas atacamensis]TSB48788.1 DUF717 domain-containing protein [Pseudomonas sp. ef1]
MHPRILARQRPHDFENCLIWFAAPLPQI